MVNSSTNRCALEAAPEILVVQCCQGLVWLMNMPPLLWGGRFKRRPGILLEPGYSLPLEQQYQVCALLAAPLEFLVVVVPCQLGELEGAISNLCALEAAPVNLCWH